MNCDNLSMRELQLESARALATIETTNNNIHQFNKKAHHDSNNWYKTVINWYINLYGGLPSTTGPGKEVKLLYEKK